jgi:hypothetical protein
MTGPIDDERGVFVVLRWRLVGTGEEISMTIDGVDTTPAALIEVDGVITLEDGGQHPWSGVTFAWSIPGLHQLVDVIDRATQPPPRSGFEPGTPEWRRWRRGKEKSP